MPAYPRSFGRLLALGFALVVLPPMVALAGSSLALERITSRSERAVYQAARATRATRALAEAVTALERSARQYLILHDADALEAYAGRRLQLAAAAAEIAPADLDAAGAGALASITAEEAGIYGVIVSDGPVKPAAMKEAARRFDALNALTAEVAKGVDAHIVEETDALRDTAEHTRRVLYIQLAALLPLVLALAVGFAVLIGRPVRALDAAIRRLGQGSLEEPVAVAGPRDFVDLGRRLEWMRGQLVSVEQDKNRFLREISHALKTPLAALREGTDLLNEGALGTLTPQQREIAEILRRNGIELQGLIEALLDYGGAQFRGAALDLVPVSLDELVHRVAQDHQLALQGKKLKLALDVQPLAVRADAGKLKGILDNLLSNAIKYSPDGGRIAVTARHDGRALLVDVADQGAGIAAEDRAHIFEPFYRGRAPAPGKVRGSGLGLSIVREYAAAHGGGIELADGGPGAHFRVTLKVERII